MKLDEIKQRAQEICAGAKAAPKKIDLDGIILKRAYCHKDADTTFTCVRKFPTKTYRIIYKVENTEDIGKTKIKSTKAYKEADDIDIEIQSIYHQISIRESEGKIQNKRLRKKAEELKIKRDEVYQKAVSFEKQGV